jgi:hypothetical protein
VACFTENPEGIVIEAVLDEAVFPAGKIYSRRPRIRALDQEVIATRKSDAVVCALCRKLVEAGHDPSLPMVVKRGDIVALRVRSIGEAAKLTVSDRKGPPKFVEWKPIERAAISSPMRDSGEDVLC